MTTAVEIHVRSVAEWADLIRDDLGRAVEGIVASGKHLIEARCDLGRGRFGDMLRALRMHERTAERLMRIAESPVLTDPALAACLPTSMRTLAELTRFPSPILKGYLENGTINVATERAQVEALLKEPKPPTHGSGSELSQRVAEAWAHSKPPVEAMEAAMARNAEAEAEAFAEEIEAEPRCSFCGEADVVVSNAAHTAFICLDCSTQAAALLAPPREEIPALDGNKLTEAVPEEVVTPTAADQHKTKRTAPRDPKGRKWNMRFRQWQQGWTWEARHKNGHGVSSSEFYETRELAQAAGRRAIETTDHIAESEEYFARVCERGTECQLTDSDWAAIRRAGTGAPQDGDEPDGDRQRATESGGNGSAP
jgi:hypothetical protein